MSQAKRAPDHQLYGIAGLIFLQMLPATLLVPAIRPLFASQHAGSEGAMHAFMSVNMAGAAVMVPFLAAFADRMARPRRLVALLAAADAILLILVSLPLSTPLVLVLRFLEGGAHVGAATVLLAESVSYCRSRGTGRAMGVVGAAIIAAVVLGSALGGAMIGLFGPKAPFLAAGGLAAFVSWWALISPSQLVSGVVHRRRLRLFAVLRAQPGLWVPVSAAFVGRFTVGCLVVTFALFAHRAHGLSDAAIGGLFSLLTLPFAVAMYPAARMSERLPNALILGLGGVIYAVCLVAVGNVPTRWLPVAMFFAGVASAMIYASTLCYASKLSGPIDRARIMGLVNIAGCVGMLLGPMVAGIITAVTTRGGTSVEGYRTVFLVAAGAVVLWLLASFPWLLARYREELSSPIPRALTVRTSEIHVEVS